MNDSKRVSPYDLGGIAKLSGKPVSLTDSLSHSRRTPKELLERIASLESQLADAKARLAWIPVSEPPTNYRDETGELIPFLACENDGDYPFRAIYDGVNWGDGMFKADITYWMPLPEGPKEDE